MLSGEGTGVGEGSELVMRGVGVIDGGDRCRR